MRYKVLPFNPSITSVGTSGNVAKQLQEVIDSQVAEGWYYQGMSSISTYVAGTSGCFGLGAQSGHNTSVQVLIFKSDT